MKTIKLPLTISSQYHQAIKRTRSTNPKTIKRLVNEVRRGDGDWVKITDADGLGYDLTDCGRGLELTHNGTRPSQS